MIDRSGLLTLRQLEYAVAVADERHFRRAAERCHVSQPALSAQVAILEDTLGVHLFERDRRGITLTTAGEEVIARARRVLLESATQIAGVIRDSRPLVRGPKPGPKPPPAKRGMR